MIDPAKFQSFQPVADLAASKLDKVALNPQPLPPKAAPGYADGTVIATPKEKAGLDFQLGAANALGTAGAEMVNPAAARVALSVQGLPQQIGQIVGDVLAKVALNPQPLPPKSIGGVIADVIGKVGIIIVSGKGKGVAMPEEEEMPPSPSPKADAHSRLAERGIIIVSGKGSGVAMPEEEEMPPSPSPKSDAHSRLAERGIIIVSGKDGKASEGQPEDEHLLGGQVASLALRSISTKALDSIIEQSIRQAAKSRI